MSGLINKIFNHVTPPDADVSTYLPRTFAMTQYNDILDSPQSEESRGRGNHSGEHQMSGRGGMGNRSQSRGRPAPELGANDESSTSIAKARVASGSRERSASKGALGREYGRGGAGNRIRSISRGPARDGIPSATPEEEAKAKFDEEAVKQIEEEDTVVEDAYKAKDHHDAFTGRGGYGNVNRPAVQE